MKRFAGVLVPLGIIGGLLAGGWLLVDGASIDVLQPAGAVAEQQLALIYLTLFLSSLVVLPVFTMLVAFAIKYRASNTKARYEPEWGENRVLEGLWWGIPIAIIAVLGVVTYQTSHSLDPYKSLASDQAPLDVEVVALRWKWLFLYPEYGVATLNHLPVEVDRPIHFRLTADAPMSAFWIPKLGSQIYAMNGMQSELNLVANQPGSFTGYTTNINGEGYSDMTFQLKALKSTEFSQWLARATQVTPQMDKPTYDTLVAPKRETRERTYRLTEPDLFAIILREHMGHDASHADHGGAR